MNATSPLDAREQVAKDAAEFVALVIENRLRDAYPEPMKHASGGFRKTLRGTITREVRLVILDILNFSTEELP